MKRLFYFTGYRLSVMHWNGKKLVGNISFEPTEEGLDEFRRYLQQTANISSKFLVDVIEEDFRNETIPHVGSKDRKSVINRLIDRYYRSSESFCYSEVIGREKTGRKDDIVLLGAMTNPQLIQPWLAIIDECEIALSGIWTLPIISKSLLRTLNASAGVVLLVSQQVNSNVRQTLFRNGKLVSSRQSIINQDIDDISEIGKLAAPEVERTIEFLRAQNLVAQDEVINLHILGADEQLQSLQQFFKSDERQSVTIHSVTKLHEKLGLHVADNIASTPSVSKKMFSNYLFSWLCLNKVVSPSHYGARQLFNRYYNKLAAMALYAASLLVAITAVMLTEANISDAMEYEKSIVLLAQEEKQYKQLYASKFEDFEEVFANAGVMNAAVDLADRISKNSKTSPLDFLIGLSDILAKDDNRNVQIDKIEWKAINVDAKSSKVQKANFTGKQPVKHDAVVTGRIDVPEDDYRGSVEHIEQIIDYLEENSRVEKVAVLRMPVDLRSESKFSSESGIDVNPASSRDTSGTFSFKITMKEPGHV
jgi:hypothetical protein